MTGNEWVTGITIENRSSAPCVLRGSVRLLRAKGPAGRILPMSLHSEGFRKPRFTILLPRENANAQLLLAGGCSASPNRMTVDIRIPGYGQTVHVHLPLRGLSCEPGGGYLFLGDFRSSGWSASVRARIEPITAIEQPGRMLGYTVTLVNTTSRAIPLPVCPTYREELDDLLNVMGRASTSRTYTLNCAGLHGSLPPRRPVRLAMEIPVPTTLLGRPEQCGFLGPWSRCDLQWNLMGGFPEADAAVRMATAGYLARRVVSQALTAPTPAD